VRAEGPGPGRLGNVSGWLVCLGWHRSRRGQIGPARGLW
jgi:hypothetical protein